MRFFVGIFFLEMFKFVDQIELCFAPGMFFRVDISGYAK